MDISKVTLSLMQALIESLLGPSVAVVVVTLDSFGSRATNFSIKITVIAEIVKLIRALPIIIIQLHCRR
jgi:hypothetical protein